MMQKHHLVPQSRGGEKTKLFDGLLHWCYHRIFGILTPEESIFLLKLLLLGKRNFWSKRDLKKLQTLILNGKTGEAKSFAQFKSNLVVIKNKAAGF